MRSSPDRQPARRAALQPGAPGRPRVRVFEIGRVFRPQWRRWPTAAAGRRRRQPCCVAGLAYGPADAVQWGEGERASTSSTSRATSNAARAAARPLRRRHPPGAASGPLRRGRTRRQPSARRRTASALAPGLRTAAGAVLFELDAAGAWRPLPAGQPDPRQQSVWRDLALVPATTSVTTAMGGHRLGGTGRLVRSARLFDVYRPAQRPPTSRRRAQPGGAAGTARRRGDADRRARSATAAACWSRLRAPSCGCAAERPGRTMRQRRQARRPGSCRASRRRR